MYCSLNLTKKKNYQYFGCLFFFNPVVKLSGGRFSREQLGLCFLPHLQPPTQCMCFSHLWLSPATVQPLVCSVWMSRLCTHLWQVNPVCFSTVITRTQSHYDATHIINVTIYCSPTYQLAIGEKKKEKQNPRGVQHKLLKKKMCLLQLVPCYPLGTFTPIGEQLGQISFWVSNLGWLSINSPCSVLSLF